MAYNPLEEFRKLLERENYTLVSGDKFGLYQQMPILCPEGHQCQISVIEWRAKTRCRRCDMYGYCSSDVFHADGYCTKGELKSIYKLTASQITDLGAPDRRVRGANTMLYKVDRVLAVRDGQIGGTAE